MGLRAAATVLALALPACADPPEPRRMARGVVVLTLDALRADVLGAYGHPRETSPNLDAFAAEALVYEHAYSAGATTRSSFAAMYTGRYPRRSSVGWWIDVGPTIAELLAARGFRTAAFGANPWLQPAYGYSRGFDDYEVFRDTDDAEVLARALEWLETHHSKPFLLWIHLLDPHSPWIRHAEAQHLYDPDYRGPLAERAKGRVRVADSDALARIRELYEGEVFRVDLLFGRLWQTLVRLGLDEDVAVVVSSDHGEELMEHGRLQHGQLTEENLHVPLLIRPPGGAAGLRISIPVGTIDLLPTVLDLVGQEPPEPFAGRSLLARGLTARPLVGVSASRGRLSVAIRVDDRKLIIRCRAYGRRRWQLFDLVDDPDERHDIAASSRETVLALERALWRELGVEDCESLARARSPETAPPDFRLSPEDRRALEALGYVVEEAPPPAR